MDIETAARLLEYRKRNGYSQEELAEKIGVSRQAISKWERSESSPDTDNLIALSKLYNVSIDELLNGRAEATQETQPPQDIIGIKDTEAPEEDGNGGSHVVRNAIISLAGLTVFLLTGFMLKWWVFNWTFLLFTICVITLIEAIESRKPDRFAFPLFAAAVFCLIGLTAHIWHPTWIIFLAIPFYYTICGAFKKKN